MVAYVGPTMIICGSDGVTSSGDVNDIEYGGVDEGGELDPASRRQRNNYVWDEDEDL